MSDMEVVKGTEFTTARDYDPKVKAQAYETFLTSDLGYAEIALDLGIPVQVVTKWAIDGKWRDRKHEIDVELFRQAEDKYRALVMKVRVPVLERHLRVSGKLEEAIDKAVDELTENGDTIDSRELKRLAESLSSVTGVSARAAGISDKFFGDALNTPGDRSGKQPLITLNVMPQLPPEKCVTVDVEE
jgi:transposase-like protein